MILCGSASVSDIIDATRISVAKLAIRTAYGLSSFYIVAAKHRAVEIFNATCYSFQFVSV
ncbi:hypothetical protein DBR43_08160 [Pedobacter sp. KBW06]|nr:hypothetical protein DBR43_08160 [Pedobacter sp. KBW06]